MRDSPADLGFEPILKTSAKPLETPAEKAAYRAYVAMLTASVVGGCVLLAIWRAKADGR